MKRVLALTAAATLTGLTSLLATAAPAAAMNPCQSYDPPAYCFEEPPPPPPPAPTAPAALTATSILQTSVTLQWADQSTTETGFTIRRVTGGITSYFTRPANATSFPDTAAPAGSYIEYYVWAERCDEVACSASAAVRVAVRTHAQPANPTGVQSTNTVTGTWASYSITGWAIDYDTINPIQVALVVDGAIVETKTADAANSTGNNANPGYGAYHGYTFTGVKSTAVGTTHTVCVRATNVGGGVDTNLSCSSYTIYGPPTNLTLTNTGTSMVIGYTDNAKDETGYVLQRSTDAQASWLSVGSQYPPISGVGSRGTATDYSSPPAGTCYRILMIKSSGNTPSAPVCS
jgi:hypothetical protein